jgi:(E)-4-hydroxy-3-methylbut-2-enyl-diphosphate synthase
VSGVRDLVDVYRLLAARSDYPLHLGLTEAGMGDKGIVASTAGLAILLNEGIGDTIRVSLTPEPGARASARSRSPSRSSSRWAALVPAAGLGLPGLRPDDVDVLPGDGPADPGLPQGPDARVARDAPGAEELRVAVMGCVVNGPGESKHADIGISCRARSRSPSRRCSSTAASIARCVATARRRVHRDPRGLRLAAIPVASRTDAGDHVT